MAYIQPDREVQYFSLGTVSTEHKKKPNADTIYEIGSISKTFTSLMLARMVEQGLVSLQTPIGKILPDSISLPTFKGEKITLLNLSTHTSGLPSLPANFNPPDWQNPYADYSVQEMFTFLNQYELTRSPGSQFAYSNLGAGLLGYLLALKAGMPYGQLLEKYITIPLKLEDTGIKVPKRKQNRFAAPYNFGQPVKHWDFPTLAGAGGIRSTVNDLITYLKAQMGFTKIPFDSSIAMTHHIRFNMDSTRAIGLAWFHLKKHDPIIWHSGGTGGYRSFIGWNRKDKTGVIILTSGTKSVTDIALHMLDSKYEIQIQLKWMLVHFSRIPAIIKSLPILG